MAPEVIRPAEGFGTEGFVQTEGIGQMEGVGMMEGTAKNAASKARAVSAAPKRQIRRSLSGSAPRPISTRSATTYAPR